MRVWVDGESFITMRTESWSWGECGLKETSHWCAAVRRGVRVWFSWQEPKGWELSSWGFSEQMASQKQWVDVGVHKLHGICSSPSVRKWGRLQRLWHSGVCWAPRAGCGTGCECWGVDFKESWRASKEGRLEELRSLQQGLGWRRWTFSFLRSGLWQRWGMIMKWALLEFIGLFCSFQHDLTGLID